MSGAHNFEHLPLLLRYRGRARLRGGAKTNPQTLANKNARQAHSAALQRAAQALSGNWKQRQAQRQGQALPVIPNGIPDEERATANTDHRTTFITSGSIEIHAAECHVYQVPIPAELRQQADEFDLRIDVTLSYVAQPRRTRRNLRRYLSTWVDWKTSNLGEGLNDFRVRALKNAANDGEPLPGSTLPWTLHENPKWGVIRDHKRNSGTVQKDWAIVRSNALPDHFCIAVVGHQGWSHDPDTTARYALAVTFEIVEQEISIYDPLRTAVLELKTQIESEVETDVEIEVELSTDE